jgi:hypothetical protein
MKKLTTYQERLIRQLIDWRQEGVQPTVKLIVETLGMSGNRAAIYTLRSLGDKGYLNKADKPSQSTYPTDKALREFPPVRMFEIYEKGNAASADNQPFDTSIGSSSPRITKDAPITFAPSHHERLTGTAIDTRLDEIVKSIHNIATTVQGLGTGTSPKDADKRPNIWKQTVQACVVFTVGILLISQMISDSLSKVVLLTLLILVTLAKGVGK